MFQFDSAIGAQAAKKIQPSSMLELSDANGLMRLMTGGDGQEQPIDKYVRFKNNIMLWYQEMDNYGLTKEEQEVLKPHFLKSHGVPPSQEQLMTMLMDEGICGFSLKEANAARKIVGKKQMSKIPELHQQIIDQAKSSALAKYVWDCGVGPQMGYAFSCIHALAYSFIGFQSAYIATHWNPIYWNAACLVVNSGSLEQEEEKIVSIYEKENPDYEYEDLPDRSGKKKKDKSADYAKVAKAIGAIKERGIEVSLININTSDYGFKPDVEHNRILYGLKAISNINSEIIEKIKAGRPYNGIKDFMSRCSLTKTAMINLIKAGAFDEIDTDFKDRKTIMVYYISRICEPKKRLTLQNFNGLIQHGLIPQELELQIRIYNFNKYLKNFKIGKYYTLDNACIQFIDNFLIDVIENVEIINGVNCIVQTTWDKMYKIYMDDVRVWLTNNQEIVLKEYNKMLFKEVWDKYAEGTISKWEMDSLCFYHSPHELINVNYNKYGITSILDMPAEPAVDYFFKRGNNQIPIYKLYKIIGTVVAKNDTRHTLSFLTPDGMINVKMSGDQYATFKKQVSEIQPDGKKKILERSWFGRGNKLMLTGYRNGDDFRIKTYKSTQSHSMYHIDEVIGDSIMIRHDRVSSNNSLEEDEYEN